MGAMNKFQKIEFSALVPSLSWQLGTRPFWDRITIEMNGMTLIATVQGEIQFYSVN